MTRESITDNAYRLDRFVEAQEPVYAHVLAELRAGRKRTHWMWFVFPQLRGLGRSAMAERYGISSMAEARAYLGHAVLGARLRECVGLVNGLEGRTVGEIFGEPDDLKFWSSITLFGRTSGSGAEEGSEFRAALAKYFGGVEDARTVEMLRR